MNAQAHREVHPCTDRILKRYHAANIVFLQEVEMSDFSLSILFFF